MGAAEIIEEYTIPARIVPRSVTVDWLADHGGRALTAAEIVEGYCQHLVSEGVALMRVSLNLPTLHPEVLGRGISWSRASGTSETNRGHETLKSSEFLLSPVALIHQGAGAIRRRLERADTPRDFPILHDLDNAGATDYVVMPLRFTDRLSFISFASNRPGGFDARQLSLLDATVPLLALRLEVRATRTMLDDVLNTYLGRSAANQVLSGVVQRGQGSPIEAAIWYSDLRGFTAMADQMRPRDLIVTLDEYFECLARPIQEAGGEVLKFIGDGLLAIFPCREDDECDACDRALGAAVEAFKRLHVLNQGRALEGGTPLKIGLALHRGEVVFGNIGAVDRLDFTVIGTAVNHVSRLEAQTKVLGRPLVTSASFAASLNGRALDSLGFHALRGIKEPHELFGLPTGLMDH